MIDEDELRAITDATDGGFYHVADESDLPETLERVAENESEFTDTDADADGFPDVVENAPATRPPCRPERLISIP